jgi:hypothetical protein
MPQQHAAIACDNSMRRLLAAVACGGCLRRLLAAVACGGCLRRLLAAVACSGCLRRLLAAVACGGCLRRLLAAVACGGCLRRLLAAVACGNRKRLARRQASFPCGPASSTYSRGVTDRRSVILPFRTLFPVSRTHDPLFRLWSVPTACFSPNNGSSVRSAAKMACFSKIAEPVSVRPTVR